jgi:hypothetical protein
MAGINIIRGIDTLLSPQPQGNRPSLGGRTGEGERAVANVDEDSITMAVEAVRDVFGFCP